MIPQALEPEIQRVAYAVQQGAEAVGTIALDVLVRVLCAGDLKHPHPHRAVPEQFQRAEGGFLARLVGVVTQDDLIGVLADEPHLLRRQGRAAGADGGVDARLLHTDDIHIAFAEDEPAGRALFGDLQREHRLGFVVDQRFGAVDIFGLGVIQHTPAKRDDVAAQVEDGGHDPLPEQTVDAPGSAALEQAAGVQLLLVVALIPQELIEGLPIVGGITEAEPHDGLIVQPAAAPVGAGLPGLLDGRIQAGVEEAGRFAVHREDAAAHPPGLVVLLRLRHPGAGCQHLDGLAVVDAVDLFGEADGIAARPAAKAVEALGVRVDVERGGLLAVERTQAAIEAALPFQLHIAAHQIDDVGAAVQLFNVLVWDHGSFFLLPFITRATCGARTHPQRSGWRTRRSCR